MRRKDKDKVAVKKMEWEVEELCKLGKIQPDILEIALKELWERKPALYNLNFWLYGHYALNLYTYTLLSKIRRKLCKVFIYA